MLRRLREVIVEMRKERQKKKTEREKMKRRSRKFGQAELKHSRRGVMSCLLAGLTLFFMVLVFSVSYISRGDVSILIGTVGLGCLILAFSGLNQGIQGFKERDKNYLTCKIGVVSNGLFVLGLLIIFLRGLF
ncbi:DUF6142 family protein [Sporofaciens sp. SGI.106]|uniref:DUF6142 family protein n=1 Tax=Sporofaciens sp. SGI.106 TaxID=3420568 RepID=UPI002A9DB269|nr:DUF6142 family protein [Lachnoclostridium sp.]